jgi:myo-inositol-1(or 4)-monophosphatase
MTGPLERELQAARAAVDAAVAVLRERRPGRLALERIGKQAKDFLTDVDLAAESALADALAASTPDIGFYGEERGGPALETGRVWVADPLDGTVNYVTGSPLCGVMLALVEDGRPVLGVLELPFLGARLEARAGAGARVDGAVARVSDVGALEDGIVGMGDAFHRGGARQDAYLALTATAHRRALRFRCVGSAAVLWAWLAGGQIQAMLLAHNNPYDVLAGQVIAAEAGATVSDYGGEPLTLASAGALACVPGIRGELLGLASDLADAARGT